MSEVKEGLVTILSRELKRIADAMDTLTEVTVVLTTEVMDMHDELALFTAKLEKDGLKTKAT